MRRLGRIVAGAALGLVLIAASGCQAEKTDLSAKEKVDFKGHPEPPGARAAMAESIARWKKRHGQETASNAPTPAGGTASPGR